MFAMVRNAHHGRINVTKLTYSRQKLRSSCLLSMF